MKITRTATKDFVQIANSAVRDRRLSWRARGLLAELLSYPDGWETTVDKLVTLGRAAGEVAEGQRAMRTAMSELATVGYVRYVRKPGKGGRWGTEIHVSDTPFGSPTDVAVSDTSVTDDAVSGTSVADTSDTDTAVTAPVSERRSTKTDKKDLHKETQRSSSSRPKEIERIMSATGADEDEASLILKRIQNENVIEKSIGAYMKGIPDADLLTYLEDLRNPKPSAFADLFAAEKSEQGRADFARSLHDMPKCEHGTRGGHVPYPPTGWVACAIERNKPQGYQAYRNPPDRDYDDWLAEGPPAPQKDYRTGTL